MSATQWRAQGDRTAYEANRKIRKTLGKPRKAALISDCYIDSRAATPTWRYEMSDESNPVTGTIEIKELPEHAVVYLRHVGSYGQAALMPRLVQKLREWAVPRGLYTADTRLLLVAHDSPSITEEDKQRLSVCFTVPPGTAGEGEVGTMTIPGGTFAVGHFEILPERIAEAWSVVMGDWLLGSGFQPDDRLCYEEADHEALLERWQERAQRLEDTACADGMSEACTAANNRREAADLAYAEWSVANGRVVPDDWWW